MIKMSLNLDLGLFGVRPAMVYASVSFDYTKGSDEALDAKAALKQVEIFAANVGFVDVTPLVDSWRIRQKIETLFEDELVKRLDVSQSNDFRVLTLSTMNTAEESASRNLDGGTP